MVQGAQQRPRNGLRPVAVRMLRTGSLQVNTLTRFFLTLVVLPLRTRLSMQLEILALRHQLAVYQQSGVRPRIKPVDLSLPRTRVETELLPSSTPTAGHMASLGFSPRGRNADECG
jgi:hypothetical protein